MSLSIYKKLFFVITWMKIKLMITGIYAKKETVTFVKWKKEWKSIILARGFERTDKLQPLESRKFLNRDYELSFSNVIAHVWIFECAICFKEQKPMRVKCQWLSDSLFHSLSLYIYMRYIHSPYYFCLGTWHHKRDESYVLFLYFFPRK